MPPHNDALVSGRIEVQPWLRSELCDDATTATAIKSIAVMESVAAVRTSCDLMDIVAVSHMLSGWSGPRFSRLPLMSCFRTNYHGTWVFLQNLAAVNATRVPFLLMKSVQHRELALPSVIWAVVHALTCRPGPRFKPGDMKRNVLPLDLMLHQEMILLKGWQKVRRQYMLPLLNRHIELLVYVVKASNNQNKERKPGLVFTRVLETKWMHES